MKFFSRLLICVFLLSVVAARSADPKPKPAGGTVSGTVIDQSADHPVEFATVVLKNADGSVAQTVVTDKQGHFTAEKLPAGEYRAVYSFVGTEAHESAAFTVDAAHPARNLGNLDLGAGIVKLEKFQVQGTQAAMLNGIDRKVYNVGKEIQSAAGSASDLLQNIPSVDVDIDGNVSLRGSDNVTILINGRTSALMGKSRADVLAQLPADSIEKIEVITNPSAKFKPDGTAGIINIALKKKHESGHSATTTLNVGNRDRYNASLTANYNPGPYNLSGNFSARQDDRPRTASDVRTLIDPTTGAATVADKKSTESSRPFTWIARGGIAYNASEHDKLGFDASFNDRGFFRHATDINLNRGANGAVSSDYDRTRTDPESERSAEGSATYQHAFGKEDQELNVELKSALTKESESDHYINSYRFPVIVSTYNNVFIKNLTRESEVITEYVHPFEGGSKLETGYNLTDEHFDADFRNENRDPATGAWLTDLAKTNRFILDRTIHAFYATYSRSIGKFGFLAGLRPEIATVRSHLVTTGVTVPTDYTRAYPSLHTAYQFTDKHEVQLNYSHRVHRPESDDLNPFPEYTDPFNLRAGNPRLRPEQIHSIEAGYAYHDDDRSFTSTVYHRYLYNGFTNITQDLGGGVLLTTHQNLAQSRSTGLELTANGDVGKLATINFSSNTFFNTLDASNLGYSASKSDVSWIAKLGATFHLPQNTLLQFHTNYTSHRLTAQGYRRPTYVANIGARHDFWQKRAAVILTVSDVFNSLKESYVINTPTLKEDVARRRSSRIVYLGFIYTFGKPTKKSKDDPMKFDNAL